MEEVDGVLSCTYSYINCLSIIIQKRPVKKDTPNITTCNEGCTTSKIKL